MVDAALENRHRKSPLLLKVTGFYLYMVVLEFSVVAVSLIYIFLPGQLQKLTDARFHVALNGL